MPRTEASTHPSGRNSLSCGPQSIRLWGRRVRGAARRAERRGRQVVGLIGRERESADLARLLAGGVRYVCVSGRAGAGKTALLGSLVAAPPTGFEVVAVDLVGAPEHARLLDEIARRIGTRGDGDDESQSADRIAAVLGTGGTTLLVVDHADSCRLDDATIAELLAKCAGLTLVVARRTPLPAASDVPLLPLAVPAEGATLDQILTNASVRLLADRAMRTNARLRLEADTAESMAAICRMVGGLPLALELAAARLTVLSADRLARELGAGGDSRGLDLLSPGGGPRRIGIREALASTLAQLTARERDLLAELSGLAGPIPFTVAVSLSADDAPGQVLDDLQRLVDLRLIDPCDTDGDEAVFDLLPIVRTFVTESIPPDPERGRRRREVLAPMLSDAAAALQSARTSDTVVLARVMRRDLLAEAAALMTEDFEAAAEWLVACADVLAGLPERVSVTELLEELIATGGVDRLDPRLQTQVWMWSSHLLSLSPDGAGLSEVVAERRDKAAALIDAERWPQLALQLKLISILNFVTTGDLRMAVQSATDGARLADAIVNPHWGARFDVWLASAAHAGGDIARAVEIALGALDRAQRVQDPYAIVVATVLLHTLPAGSVPVDAPVPPLTTALELARARGEIVLERFALAALTSEERNAGRPRTAARWCAELLSQRAYAGWLLETEIALIQTVIIAADLGDHGFAAGTLGAVRADLDRVLRAMAPRTRERIETIQADLRMRLGPAHAAALIGAGAVLSIPDAADEALRWLRAHAAAPDTEEPVELPTQLTPREQDVLGVLAEGFTNKEIAARLGLSVKTVMHHSVAIYRKLDVRGRAEATAYAHRHDLLGRGGAEPVA